MVGLINWFCFFGFFLSLVVPTISGAAPANRRGAISLHSDHPHHPDHPHGGSLDRTKIKVTKVASGMVKPTSMVFSKSGRLFITQQSGAIYLYEDSLLQTTPFMNLTVDYSFERGLLGMALDPDFETNRYFYLYYTVDQPYSHMRVSRFTSLGDRADRSSEVVLMDFPALDGATSHHGGAIHFGPDGKLYVAVGDHYKAGEAQSLNSLFGKILRINSDGSIPEDNPFYRETTGLHKAIYALGLRNPFTFAFGPDQRLYANDVGGIEWEEVNDIKPGGNYGWPEVEGPSNDERFLTPITAYPHPPVDNPGAWRSADYGCAVVGGTFFDTEKTSFPELMQGNYLYSDFCHGWIRRFNPKTGDSEVLIENGPNYVADIDVGPDGAIYFVTTWGGSLYRIDYSDVDPDLLPQIFEQPTSLSVAEGEAIQFFVGATNADSYQWQVNNVDIPGAVSSRYETESSHGRQSGSEYRVIVKNRYGSKVSSIARLTVQSPQAPIAHFFYPEDQSIYRGGDEIWFGGNGFSPQGQEMPKSSLHWTVNFHHSDHFHPFMTVEHDDVGKLVVPQDGEKATDVFFRIHLRVQDSEGRTTEISRDLKPKLANMVIRSQPEGIVFKVDGRPAYGVAAFDGVVRTHRKLEALPVFYADDGRVFRFNSWSNGGAATHTIEFPELDTNLVLLYDQVVDPVALRELRSRRPQRQRSKRLGPVTP